MKIQNAIEKAIEKGWQGANGSTESDCHSCEFIDGMLLDPKFWQCLGKAMGWDEEAPKGYTAFKDIKDEFGHTQSYWNYMWHRLIDHLSEGETIEKYFEELK